MTDLIKLDNDTLITELLTVSKYFNKAHRNLMRDIKRIIKDLPELENEFIKTTYRVNNTPYDTYYLTEKGFYILTSSFTGTHARLWQSKFFDEFKRLRDENKLLRVECTKLIKCVKHLTKIEHVFNTDEILDEFKRLRDENKLLTELQYQEKHTYCISDIVQRFKDIEPWEAQYQLYCDGILEHRQTGFYPSEYYDKNHTIVSVLDTKRNKYYPRYTVKGVKFVEEYLIEKGYQLK